ncbi:MAG: FtsH protease activity modulator HflK [Betaproteobacteria bacterium]|nr:FtsH protease activity modulator HflK [Betaproteobacteria bacterium]MBV9360760.1 FtsH protease activity modulator HflK [Betaproteobacteria bacterium]
MSLNDPNWGRGGSRGPQGPGNQGPPDLDELWRNFNRRLGELFRRRPRGAGDEPPRPPSARGIGGGASALIGLVLAVWLASGFYIVVEGQRGIVLTFGRFAKETTAGLNWRMPWPIQSHEIVNLSQVRTLEVGYRNNVRTKVLKESLMLTDDENIVDLQFAVQYVVKDAQAYIFNVRRPDESAMQIAETAMREVIGKNRMDAILYETQVDVANKARDLMQAIHDRYNTGIQISTVTIQNAQPPEQVQAAFDDAVKAGQDRERQKNEGQAYANDVIPRARGAASRLQQEAEGYKQRVIANAEGEASRFRQVLSEYAKAPQVTRERMYIDTMREILSANNKIMMDYRGNGNLLMLPLDKLMQQAATGTPSGPQAAPPANEAQAPDANPRSRESLRNRDRADR